MRLSSFHKKWPVLLVVFFSFSFALQIKTVHSFEGYSFEGIPVPPPIPAAPVFVTEDIPKLKEEIVEEAVKRPLKVSFLMIFWNLLQYVTDRLAYEAAVGIATGATGGDPLVELRDGDTLGRDLLYDVVGAAIAALGDGISLAGVHFNLCAPSEIGLFNLQLGLREVYSPEPRCDFQDALDNWTTVYTTLDDELTAIGEDPTRSVLTYFANAINPRGTELTASIAIYSQVFEEANEEKNYGLAELLAKGGFKDLSDIVSGKIKTPAAYIAEDQSLWQTYLTPSHRPQTWFNTMVANPDLWKQLGLSATSVFTNAFLSTFADRILTGYFPTTTTETTDPFDIESISFAGGQDAAEDFYRTIYTTAPISLDSYSAISQFVSCPDLTTRELGTCVMDEDFATAVGSSDSGDPFIVQEAIDENLLHGDWPLISSTDSRNLDKDCYTYGYCFSNLVQLRKARVIPVGWEMATDLQGTSADTLQEVIDGFDDCDEDGERSDSYPYCHLIDPNWPLKYPSTKCEAQVPGQLVSSAGTTRANECVDAPSCIEEDASGECVGGYGYCMREQNIYQFRGQDCPEQYGTCLSFTSDDGDSADLLFNTLDESICDSDNAGCLWYSTVKEEDDEGAFDWPEIADALGEDRATGTYQNRIYFNDEVEDCDDDDAGCRRLVEDTDDVELNLIINPSFESDEDEDDIPDHWLTTSSIDYDTSSELSLVASAVVNPGTSFLYQQNIPIQGSTFYTLSFYAAQPSDTASNSLTAYVVMDSRDGSEPIDLTDTSYDSDNCTLVSTDGDATLESLLITATPESDDYERFTCTFTSPTLNDPSIGVRIAFLDFSGDVLLDAVQLEPDEDVDDFREGYGDALGSLPVAYYKLPPAYLGCEGDSDDPDECENYAQMCTVQDVGCNLYTPVNENPSVPGIANDLDECPEECAGYDTYKQEPTLYEPNGAFPLYFIPDTAISCTEQYVGCDEFTNLTDESEEYYTYLRACLTTDQASTDAAVYYTWEGSDLEGFQLVSWNLFESDESDAPCVTWETTDAGITCDDASPTVTDTTCDEHDDIFDEPNCREFYDVDGDIFYRLFDDTVTITDSCIPYRKTETVGAGEDDDADGTDDGQENCEDARGYWDSTVGVCKFYGYSEESDSCPSTQNGCREYTGGAGRNSSIVFSDNHEDEDIDEYDVEDATAEISNESVATDGHSLHVTTTAASGYVFTAYADLDDCSESDSCDEDSSDGTCDEEDGCDVASGSLGFECTVEEDATDCGELVDALAEDKVYVLSLWAKSSDNDTSITPEFIYEGGSGSAQVFESVDLTTSWEEFTVGPLDTTDTDFDDTAVLAFLGTALGDDFYIDNVTLRQTEEEITIIKDSWETPSTCDETEEGAASAQYHLGCQEYTDMEGDTVYLKSFTRLCDEDVLGCGAFFDTQGSESPYGAVFNMRCDNADGADAGSQPDIADAQVACELDGETLCTIQVGASYCLFDWEGGEPRNDDGTVIDPDDADMDIVLAAEAEVVPADQKVYFVADSEFACDSTVMGCEEVGLPTFSQDGSRVDSWTTTYLLNLPDEYEDQLCSHEALFCEAWETTESSTYYFKNPNDKACEYQTGVDLNGTSYSGWFREGTTEFCYGEGTCSVGGNACNADADCTASTDDETDECEITTGTYLAGGTASSIWRNGDDDYDGWAGLCDAQYDLCTEFIDPIDTGEDLYGEDEGESYFFINDALLDDSNLSTSKQCNGQVGQKRGCALFNDILQGELTYNASASYIRSAHAPQFDAAADSYDLVDPISCPDDGTVELTDGTEVDLCTQRCAYDTELLHPYDSATGTTYTGACLSDSDCPDLVSDGGDLVDGACEADATALEDDTNTVIKVNLDRACAEWLACDSTTTVWDTSTSSYQITCDSVNACNEYTALGDSTFCASWSPDEPPAVLTVDRYASRDVSWYGYEYAGYSIPNQIEPQYLSQVNVSPSLVCAISSSVDGVDVLTPLDGSYAGSDLPYIECTEDDSECGGVSYICYGGTNDGELCIGPSDTSCEDVNGEGSCDAVICRASVYDEDYRLSYYAGACVDEDGDGVVLNGESCTIGFCSDTGAPCGADEECDSDLCATGYCAYEIPSTSCDFDSQCDSGLTCIEGACQALSSAACGEPSDCAPFGTTDITCVQAAATQNGACFNNRCLLTVRDEDGDGEAEPFSLDDGEALECRGWPETNAPFPNSVVETWVDALNPTDDTVVVTPEDFGQDAEAYELVSTFESVNLCVGDQDCDCSYDKVTYGSATRYYDEGATDIATILCVGGTYDGARCSDFDGMLTGYDYDSTIDDEDEPNCETSGGTCEIKTQQSSLVGWQGYCLERDLRTQVNGDADEDACITWLPVDRLSGASDIYGKFTEAGYPLTDTYYCGEVDMYVDVPISNYGTSSGAIACAEHESSHDCWTSGGWEEKLRGDGNAVCPEGMYAILGRCIYTDDTDDDSGGDNYFAVCEGGTSGYNDHPYICVPGDPEVFGSDSDADVNDLYSETDTIQYVPVHTNSDSEYFGQPCYDPLYLESVGTLSNINGGSVFGDIKYSDYDYETSTFTADSSDGNRVYRMESSAEEFASLIDYYSDCQVMGFDYATTQSDGTFDVDFPDFAHSDFCTDGLGTCTNAWSELNFVDRVYPACTTLLQVASTDQNRAWTNRLLHDDFAIQGVVDELAYTAETVRTPFGSAWAPETINAPEWDDPAPARILACRDGSYTYADADFLPELGGTCPSGYDYAFYYYEGFGDSGDPEARSFVEDFSDSTNSFLDQISQIFGNALSVFSWYDNGGDGHGGYDNGQETTNGSANGLADLSPTDHDYDVTAVGDANAEDGIPSAPIVRSIGDTCVDDSCQEGSDNTFSINGYDDTNLTGTGGQFLADLKFYVEANANQMPIRRVIIDWQDETDGSDQTGSVSDNNYYKNARGLNNANEEICGTDPQNWGEESSACTSTYYNYTHAYTCAESFRDDLEVCDYDDDGLPHITPCSNGSSCYFRPRVHIRDNWGWCTGTCPDTVTNPGNGDGCYGSMEDMDSSGAANECDLDRPDNSTFDEDDPWVYYDGVIIVEP